MIMENRATLFVSVINWAWSRDVVPRRLIKIDVDWFSNLSISSSAAQLCMKKSRKFSLSLLAFFHDSLINIPWRVWLNCIKFFLHLVASHGAMQLSDDVLKFMWLRLAI